MSASVILMRTTRFGHPDDSARKDAADVRQTATNKTKSLRKAQFPLAKCCQAHPDSL